jgi:hypothetical protein
MNGEIRTGMDAASAFNDEERSVRTVVKEAYNRKMIQNSGMILPALKDGYHRSARYGYYACPYPNKQNHGVPPPYFFFLLDTSSTFSTSR